MNHLKISLLIPLLLTSVSWAARSTDDAFTDQAQSIKTQTVELGQRIAVNCGKGKDCPAKGFQPAKPGEPTELVFDPAKDAYRCSVIPLDTGKRSPQEQKDLYPNGVSVRISKETLSNKCERIKEGGGNFAGRFDCSKMPGSEIKSPVAEFLETKQIFSFQMSCFINNGWNVDGKAHPTPDPS